MMQVPTMVLHLNVVQWKKGTPIKGNNISVSLCPSKLLLKYCFPLQTTHFASGRIITREGNDPHSLSILRGQGRQRQGISGTFIIVTC